MQGSNVFALVVLIASARAGLLPGYKRVEDQPQEYPALQPPHTPHQPHDHSSNKHRDHTPHQPRDHPPHQPREDTPHQPREDTPQLPGDDNNASVYSNDRFTGNLNLFEQLSEILRPFFLSSESSTESLDNLKKAGSSVEILPLHPTPINRHTKAPLALILSTPKGRQKHGKYVYNKKNKNGRVKANVEISNDDSDEKPWIMKYNASSKPNKYSLSNFKVTNLANLGNTRKDDNESNYDHDSSEQWNDNKSSSTFGDVTSEAIIGSLEQTDFKPWIMKYNASSKPNKHSLSNFKVTNLASLGNTRKDDNESNYDHDSSEQWNDNKSSSSFGDVTSEAITGSLEQTDFTNDKTVFQSNIDGDGDDSNDSENNGSNVEDDSNGVNEGLNLTNEKGIDDISSTDYLHYDSSMKDDSREVGAKSQFNPKEINSDTDSDKETGFAYNHASASDNMKDLFAGFNDEDAENNYIGSSELNESSASGYADSNKDYSKEMHNIENVIDYIKHIDELKNQTKEKTNDIKGDENDDKDSSDLEPALDDSKKQPSKLVVNFRDKTGVKLINGSAVKVKSRVKCPTDLKKLLKRYNSAHKSYNLSFLFYR